MPSTQCQFNVTRSHSLVNWVYQLKSTSSRIPAMVLLDSFWIISIIDIHPCPCPVSRVGRWCLEIFAFYVNKITLNVANSKYLLRSFIIMLCCLLLPERLPKPLETRIHNIWKLEIAVSFVVCAKLCTQIQVDQFTKLRVSKGLDSRRIACRCFLSAQK